MRIQLDQIADEPFRWEETPSITAATLDRLGLLGLGEIHWSGTVACDLAGWRLEARLSYRQTLNCTRCLTAVEMPVDETIELAIQVGAEEPMLGEHELTTSDLHTLFLDDEILDTTPILMEQMQLNIPMKPLCRDDCAGLCPRCGVDRNRERCACAESEIDPRWQALEQWRRG